MCTCSWIITEYFHNGSDGKLEATDLNLVIAAKINITQIIDWVNREYGDGLMIEALAITMKRKLYPTLH
jgi:hypothetical protein